MLFSGAHNAAYNAIPGCVFVAERELFRVTCSEPGVNAGVKLFHDVCHPFAPVALGSCRCAVNLSASVNRWRCWSCVHVEYSVVLGLESGTGSQLFKRHRRAS